MIWTLWVQDGYTVILQDVGNYNTQAVEIKTNAQVVRGQSVREASWSCVHD